MVRLVTYWWLGFSIIDFLSPVIISVANWEIFSYNEFNVRWGQPHHFYRSASPIPAIGISFAMLHAMLRKILPEGRMRMTSNNPVLIQLLDNHMRYMAQRQAVLSQNIANLDTPSYKAQDQSTS